MIDGIWSLVAGFRWRPSEGWGWMVFSGIVSIILGVMIWRQFPVSALWLVGVLVGIRLLFTGLTMSHCVVHIRISHLTASVLGGVSADMLVPLDIIHIEVE